MGWAHAAAAAAAFAGHLHLRSAWMDVALARERIIAAAWHSLSASCPPDGTPHADGSDGATMDYSWTPCCHACMPMMLLEGRIDVQPYILGVCDGDGRGGNDSNRQSKDMMLDAYS